MKLIGEKMHQIKKPPENRDISTDGILIQTKFHRSKVQAKLVQRPRLDLELDEGLKSKVMIVTAPAGYGKTTAVVKWVEQREVLAAWFSVDKYDSDLKRFWSYVIESLNTVLPGISSKFFGHLSTLDEMPIETVITILIGELGKFLQDIILVIDDYHLVDLATIHESICFFIKYLPLNMHLVIISRSAPPFLTMRMNLTGQVKEIKMHNLQFSTQEIADFYSQSNVHLREGEIEKLETCTEGWAAGLYLILDLVRREGNFPNLMTYLKGNHHHIATYLKEEVASSWNEETREFMLKTSILDSITASLCDAVMGKSGSEEILKDLFAQNAFIISIDDEGYWYRYHHLFSEFLQNMLGDDKRYSKETLHARAGDWYEKNGYISEAINHFLQGRAYEKAVQLIQGQCPVLQKSGETTTLKRWIDSLPPTIVENNDILCLNYALICVKTANLEATETWLTKIESKHEAINSENRNETWENQIAGEIAVIRSFIAINLNQISYALELAAKARSILPDISLVRQAGMNINIGLASLLGGVLGLNGRLSRIKQVQEGMYVKIREINRTHFGNMPVLMAELNFERNLIDDAIPVLMKGFEEAEKTSTVSTLVPALITLARVRKAKGDIKGALNVLLEGEKKIRDMGGILWLPLFYASRARLAIETGDFAVLDVWMENNCLDIYDKLSMPRIYEYITLARAYIARREYDIAILLLARLQAFSEQEQRLSYTIEVLNLLAIAYHSQGKTERSMELLHKSLQLGEQEEYIRIYVEEGTIMDVLLGRFVRWNIIHAPNEDGPVSPLYVRKLMKHTREYSLIIMSYVKENGVKGKNTQNQNWNISLTNRELDVLQLLTTELSNAEIACALDVTLNTVKVHSSSLYRKLGAKNREQATQRARELNILE